MKCSKMLTKNVQVVPLSQATANHDTIVRWRDKRQKNWYGSRKISYLFPKWGEYTAKQD